MVLYFYFLLAMLVIFESFFLSQITIYAENSNTTIPTKNTTSNNGDQTLDIVTDHFSYGIGQVVKVSGTLKDSSGGLSSGKVLINFECHNTQNNTKTAFQKFIEYV